MKFDVILADPNWGYRNKKTGGSHTSGSAQKYETMDPQEIAKLPVGQLANPKGSVLFLWATTPLGADPYMVMQAWGFRYKTEWYWHKTGRLGLGYWTRGAVEKLLIGIRGKVPAWRSTLDNWIPTDDDPRHWIEQIDSQAFEAKPEHHSRKPAVVRERIEALTPGATRVELYSTQPEVPNWTHYGLAIDPTHDFRHPDFWKQVLDAPHPRLPDPDESTLPSLADA